MLGSSSVHPHRNAEMGHLSLKRAPFKGQFHRADIFVDVGSNIGFYACLARSMGLHVIAVEPLPKTKNTYSPIF